MERTIVIGLGNPILSDDGIGVRIATDVGVRLDARRRDIATVREAPVGGIRLAEMLDGYDRAIIVDAMTDDGAPVGEVRRMDLAELKEASPTQHLASAHDTSLITALAAGRRLGMRLPDDVTIFGVVVRNVNEFSSNITPEVERSIPDIVERVLFEIEH